MTTENHLHPEQTELTEQTEDELVLRTAEEILQRYLPAFEELAK